MAHSQKISPVDLSNETPEVRGLHAFYHDPVLFVKELLGAEPDKWQAAFLRAVAANDRVAVRSGHGIGKTSALSWLVLWFLLTRFPVKIAVTAPSATQLESGLLPEVDKWMRRLPDEWRGMLSKTSDKVVLVESPGESFMVARTAARDKPEALQGIHSENMVFLIDEASGVDEIIFEVAMSSLSTKGAKVVMTGNPTRTSGYFYDAFHSMKHMWKTMRVSALDAKYSKDGPLIDEVRTKYGEDSDRWRVRVLGEFPQTDATLVIPRHLVEEASEREIAGQDAPICWGIDVAVGGADRCAIAKRKGNVLLEPVTAWTGSETPMHVAYKVRDIFNATPTPDRPEFIYIDQIVVGAAVYHLLQQLGLKGAEIVPVNVSETPSIRDRFYRLRDELWWRMREWFEQRDSKLPYDPELVEELCTPTYDYMEGSNKLKVESNKDIKKRGHRSLDLASAFMLTFMNSAEESYANNKFFGADLTGGTSAGQGYWIV